MVSIPLMTTVVPVDRAGRIVIPKETREAQGISPGTKFLLFEGKAGSLWLQRLDPQELARRIHEELRDRKSTRLNSSHGYISYAVFCLKKKKKQTNINDSISKTTLADTE